MTAHRQPFRLACVTVAISLLSQGGDLLTLHPVAPALAQATSNCFGQPTTNLTFSNPALIAGTNLQVGARYRFSSVATNVDAIIEIIGFSGGGSLFLIDNDAGITANFQPQLRAVLGGVATENGSAVDFRIEFVQGGTLNPITLDIAINSIDVDGNNATIREYVEYETTLDEFILNNPTELDVNASGPSAADRIRFESRTSQVAPGIDPTAEENIVAGLYTNVTNFEFRIGALGTGTQTRLTSLGFNCPTFPAVDLQKSLSLWVIPGLCGLKAWFPGGCGAFLRHIVRAVDLHKSLCFSPKRTLESAGNRCFRAVFRPLMSMFN